MNKNHYNEIISHLVKILRVFFYNKYSYFHQFQLAVQNTSNFTEEMKNVKHVEKILRQITTVQYAIVKKVLDARKETMTMHQNAMVNLQFDMLS